MLPRSSLTLLALCCGLVLACAPYGVESQTKNTVAAPERPARSPDVRYVPTPPAVVDAMLRLASVHKGDVLYDLGSGDGRIPIAAAQQYGIRAIGIDIDPQRVTEARAQARRARLTGRARFILGDLFEADIREASVVTLYLLDSLNEKLRPKLWRELRPGTRIVSHAFRMGDWLPEQEVNVDGHMIYLWTIPAQGKGAASR